MNLDSLLYLDQEHAFWFIDVPGDGAMIGGFRYELKMTRQKAAYEENLTKYAP